MFLVASALLTIVGCRSIESCSANEDWVFVDNSLPLEPLSDYGKKTIELYCGNQLYQVGFNTKIEIQDNLYNTSEFSLIEDAKVTIHNNRIDVLFSPVPNWKENTLLRLVVDGEKFGNDKPVPIRSETFMNSALNPRLSVLSSEIVPSESEVPWIQPKSMDFKPKSADIGEKVQFEIVFYSEENQQGVQMENLNSKYEIQYVNGSGCLLYDWSKKTYSGPEFTITSDNTFDIVIKGKYGIVFTGMFTLTSGGISPPIPKALTFEPSSVVHYSKPTFCIKLYSDEDKMNQITMETRNYVITGQYDGSCLVWEEENQCYRSKYIKIYDYNYFTITSKIHPDFELKGYYDVLPGDPPQQTYPPLPSSAKILSENIPYDERTDIKLKLYEGENETGNIITDESGIFTFSSGISSTEMEYDSSDQTWAAKRISFTQTKYSIFSEYFYGALVTGTVELVNNTSDNNLSPNWNIISYFEDYTQDDCYPPWCKEEGSKYVVFTIYTDDTLDVQRSLSNEAKVCCKTICILAEYRDDIQMLTPYWFNGIPSIGAYKTANPFEPSACDFNSIRINDPDDGTKGPIIVYEKDDIYFEKLNLPENPDPIPDYKYLITQENKEVMVGENDDIAKELSFKFTVKITSTDKVNDDLGNPRVIIDILGSLYETTKQEVTASSFISPRAEVGEVIGIYETKYLNIPEISDWDGNVSLWIDDKNSELPINMEIIPSEKPNEEGQIPTPGPVNPSEPNRLEVGEIVGIAIGCVAAVLIIVLGVLFGKHIISCPGRKGTKKSDKRNNVEGESKNTQEKADVESRNEEKTVSQSHTSTEDRTFSREVSSSKSAETKDDRDMSEESSSVSSSNSSTSETSSQ